MEVDTKTGAITAAGKNFRFEVGSYEDSFIKSMCKREVGERVPWQKLLTPVTRLDQSTQNQAGMKDDALRRKITHTAYRVNELLCKQFDIKESIFASEDGQVYRKF